MKNYVKIFSLIALFSISSISLAHEWFFHNITDKILVVQVKLARIADNFFNIVGPGQKTDFSWTGINPRSSDCLEYISIGEYNEQAIKFPGTGTLPRVSGKKELDKTAITNEINKRGQWFNSLAQVDKKKDLAIYVLEESQWKSVNDKLNSVAARLLNGSSIQDDMRVKQAAIDNELKTVVPIKIKGPDADYLLVRKGFECQSHNFIIFNFNGELILITKK